MRINEQLKDLYSKQWVNLLDQLEKKDKEKYTNPFLISIDEEKLASADMKVMIFGQETKGWGDESGFSRTVDEGMNRYRSFCSKEEPYKGFKKSAFWKAFKFFEVELNRHHKDQEFFYIWNNISKIGKENGKTGISSEIRSIERDLFPVISEEVNIIKPDMIIFLTGPYRDHDIKFHFPDVEFSSLDTNKNKRQLAKVTSKYLPSAAIRTYHPSFYKGFNVWKENAVNLLTENSI